VVFERPPPQLEGGPARDLDDLAAMDAEARRIAAALTRQLVH
jgi:hypothetical protein